MVGAISFLLGDVPNPGVIAGIMVIGIGVGMVVARFGNMGPFQGEFGSPWFETDLGETLRKEVARAARFGRELSIVVVRQRGGPAVQWVERVRAADDVIACRNGWHVLILPETGKDGAQTLVERAVEGAKVEVQVAIMDPSVTHHDPQKLGEALLNLVRTPPASSSADRTIAVKSDTDRLQWPAG